VREERAMVVRGAAGVARPARVWGSMGRNAQ
jgi:hypothetical protein